MDPQSPQIQQPMTMPPQMPSLEAKQRGSTGKVFLNIVGIIVIFGLIGGAYYLGIRQVGSQLFLPKVGMSVIPTHSLLPSITPTTHSQTVQWKTYINKIYSIQYPANWIIEFAQSSDPTAQTIRIFNPQTMTPQYGNGGYSGLEVPTEEILITASLTNKTAVEYVSSLTPDTSNPLYKDFINGEKTFSLNGITAYVYPDTGEGSSGDNVVVDNASGTLVVMHTIGSYSKGITNQIISTFKFNQY